MSPQSFLLVTIDGGAATGKSSTAARVARIFGLLHADTGSDYRALTLRLREMGLTPEEGPSLEKALRSLHLSTELRDNCSEIRVDGRSYSRQDLRNDEANAWVSQFAALPSVRHKLLDYQRSQKVFAEKSGFPGLIVEGRDIGSVIFPEAPFRFYLTADTRTRKTRRLGQGEKDSIEDRDKRDSGRQTAPLIKPEGALEIDTSHLSLDEVVESIVGVIRKHFS